MVCTFNSIFYYQSATALPGTYDSLLKLKKKSYALSHLNLIQIFVVLQLVFLWDVKKELKTEIFLLPTFKYLILVVF